MPDLGDQVALVGSDTLSLAFRDSILRLNLGDILDWKLDDVVPELQRFSQIVSVECFQGSFHFLQKQTTTAGERSFDVVPLCLGLEVPNLPVAVPVGFRQQPSCRYEACFLADQHILEFRLSSYFRLEHARIILGFEGRFALLNPRKSFPWLRSIIQGTRDFRLVVEQYLVESIFVHHHRQWPFDQPTGNYPHVGIPDSEDEIELNSLPLFVFAGCQQHVDPWIVADQIENPQPPDFLGN